nr:glycosyltransferase [Nocardia tengchongensis]
MSRIVLVGIGSRGDIAPLTGLGVGLRDAGHEVVVAAHTLFAEQITRCGLEFREMTHDIDIDMTDPDVNRLSAGWKFSSPKGVRSLGLGMIRALIDEPADVLLLPPPTEYAAWRWPRPRASPRSDCGSSRCPPPPTTRPRPTAPTISARAATGSPPTSGPGSTTASTRARSPSSAANSACRRSRCTTCVGPAPRRAGRCSTATPPVSFRARPIGGRGWR